MAERCLEASSWQTEALSLGLTGASKGGAILEVQSSENRRNNVFWMNVSLLIILLHEALQRCRGKRGGPSTSPCHAPTSRDSCTNKGVWKNQSPRAESSSQNNLFQREGVHQQCRPRGSALPTGKSAAVPRVGCVLGGSERGCLLLPVPGIVLVWGCCCAAGGFPMPGCQRDSRDREMWCWEVSTGRASHKPAALRNPR